jgi:hypothetical protein
MSAADELRMVAALHIGREITNHYRDTGGLPARVGVYGDMMYALTGSLDADRAEVMGVEVVKIDLLVEAVTR